MAPETMMKIAIFDDYQNGALQMADWTAIPKRAEVTVFNHHLSDPDAVVRRLRKPTAEAIVRAVRRDPEGLLDADPACTLLAPPIGVVQKSLILLVLTG
jgi:hypothetical protein